MTRVFILSHHPMFGRGLESLLHREAGLELVGQETDEEKAIEQIKALQAQVVIWDSSKTQDGAMPTIISVLRENPGIRVIGLSLHDNNLYIYQVTQRIANDLEELIEAIRL
jgi:DNA-binding NarL/FixJ family response regulator